MSSINTFKIFSEINPEALKDLKPDFGFRNWNNLSKDEKITIWLNLKFFFFDLKKDGYKYIFYNNFSLYGKTQKQNVVNKTIIDFNSENKILNLCKNLINTSGDNRIDIPCCDDFLYIFFNSKGNIVYQLISIYINNYINELSKNIYDNGEIKKEENLKIKIDNLIKYIEDVFSQFQIDYKITKNGIIPRQDKKIMEIYEPVLQVLGEKNFIEINNIIFDSFKDFRNGDFSGCITHTSSFLQGYLQIKVNGRVGKGSVLNLINDGISKKIIPDDFFTKNIFKNIESIFAKERKEKGDPHPKSDYANEKTALLLLNLAMVFIQHIES